MRQIAATRRRDRLLQQIASCDMWKPSSLRQNFVAAICRTNSNWFELNSARYGVYHLLNIQLWFLLCYEKAVNLQHMWNLEWSNEKFL